MGGGTEGTFKISGLGDREKVTLKVGHVCKSEERATFLLLCFILGVGDSKKGRL